MILTDRVTGLAVELFISDGVSGVDTSVGTPESEPILLDAVTSKKFKVFVSDGMIGWEETTGTAVTSITIIDKSTAIAWLLKIVDEVLSYSFAFVLTTARYSKVTQTASAGSQCIDAISLGSGLKQTIGLESRVD